MYINPTVKTHPPTEYQKKQAIKEYIEGAHPSNVPSNPDTYAW